MRHELSEADRAAIAREQLKYLRKRDVTVAALVVGSLAGACVFLAGLLVMAWLS